jgi:phosphoribosylamine--glycine ligase
MTASEGERVRVLLVGGGGREHALAWKLAQSPLLSELLVAPGNVGTSLHGRNVPLAIGDPADVAEFARRAAVDFVVVGPDNALADGLVDVCAAIGIPAFGPTAAAARIESSKSFARALMQEAGVRGADFHTFDDPAEAARFARASGRPWVVKADGLALGKGVVVAESVDETAAAIEQLAQLPAGRRLVLEERLAGRELSVLALCDGAALLPLPPARDHKRLLDGDAGPNTGGMGAIAPAEVSAETLDEIVRHCMQPVVNALAARGTPFVGALYAGIMLTEDGPRVLEFNARFGDPEAQAILPLLEGDLLAALVACTQGRLADAALGWRPGYAACVVLAAQGYPAAPRTGDPISGLESVGDDVLVFHAGTAWQSGAIATSGGRVLGITGLGTSLQAALEVAYAAAETVSFDGMHFRRDIGR